MSDICSALERSLTFIYQAVSCKVSEYQTHIFMFHIQETFHVVKISSEISVINYININKFVIHLGSCRNVYNTAQYNEGLCARTGHGFLAVQQLNF